MKKILILLFLLVISASAFNQTTYYVSSSTGDDSNTGLTTSDPFATLSQVESVFTSTDTIKLFGGDIWRETLTITEDQGGTYASRTHIVTYGSGSNAKIYGSEVVSGWTASGTANVWQADYTLTDPRSSYSSEILFLDDNDSVSWGDYQTYDASFTQLTDERDWTINGTIIYTYLSSDPDLAYEYIEAPQYNSAITFVNNTPADYVDIWNVTMRFQKHDGFYNGYPAVQGATGLHFKYDTIGYISQKGSSVGYGLAIWSSNVIVENCFFSDCGRRAISNNLYLALEFASRRIIENVHIRNNTFVRGYHTSSLDLASSGDRDVAERSDTMKYIYFYNNIVDDSYIKMEGSDEASNQVFTQRGGATIEDVYIVNNLLIASTARNILCEGSDRNHIWNNTIIGHNPNTATGPYSNVSFNGATDNDFRNNILYQNLPDNDRINYGVLMEHTPSNYTNKDYNLYWQEVINADRTFTGGLQGYYDITDWEIYKTANPTHEPNSPTPENPYFIDYDNKDYMLTDTSAAKDAGEYLTVTSTDGKGETFIIGAYDINGKVRSLTTPSIGVYEYSDPDSTATNIVSFSFSEQSSVATIDTTNHTVAITVVYGTSVTSLIPTITMDFGATISPLSGVVQNFTSPVTYTVTSLDETTTQDWVVTVTVADPSTENDILTFSITNQRTSTVNDVSHTVAIEMVYGTTITGLTPTITLSANATVNPASGVIQDFSSPVTYTVTAEDGTTTQDWVVTVTVASQPTVVFWIFGTLEDYTIGTYSNGSKSVEYE